MNKQWTIYGLLIWILIGVSGYSLGYNAKHTPVYIYVKYEAAQKNLVQSLDGIGISLTPSQEAQLFKKLKEAKK